MLGTGALGTGKNNMIRVAGTITQVNRHVAGILLGVTWSSPAILHSYTDIDQAIEQQIKKISTVVRAEGKAQIR